MTTTNSNGAAKKTKTPTASDVAKLLGIPGASVSKSTRCGTQIMWLTVGDLYTTVRTEGKTAQQMAEELTANMARGEMFPVVR